MKEYSFTLEVITPLFMGGADARRNPELRPPSLRGGLRYWYRALLGGTGAGANLETEEADLFGSPKKGSQTSIMIRSSGIPNIATFKKDRAIRTRSGDFLPTGKDYLLWSMAESGRRGTSKYLPAREYIEPGTKYSLRLRSRISEVPLKKTVAALWLLGNLGALGSRARRGAGSIELIRTEPRENHPIPFRTCQSVDDLKVYLEQGLQNCKDAISGTGFAWTSFTGSLPEYSILSPMTTSIWIVADNPAGWSSEMDALQGLGARFRDFRTHLNPTGIGKADHDAVYDWLAKGGPVPNIQRAVFGLPIPFRYEGAPGDVIISTIGDRRASPLHIRVTRLNTGNFIGVMTLFKSSFLDGAGKAKIKLQTRGWRSPAPPNYGVIRNFVSTFPIHEGVPL